MEMMKKLLNGLGRTWNKLPKDIPALRIQKGTGVHGLLTITSTSLVFHSTMYDDDMPIKQSILLDGYTIDELMTVIAGMGYTVSLEQPAVTKGLHSCRATILMEGANIPIIQPYVVNAFTSEVWQLMYPIARLLEDNGRDTDGAIKQMLASSAKGVWVDYWATFFNVKRLAGESDFTLQRRVFMALTNLKTNNVAIQQLIQYALASTVVVEDVEPALFKVTVDADYINIAPYVHQIIGELRGAGIDYFLNYAKTNIANYQAYFKDRYSEEFQNSDKIGLTADRTLVEQYANPIDLVTGGGVTLPSYESYERLHFATVPFVIGVSNIGSTSEGIVSLENCAAICTMTFTQTGTNAVTKTANLI